MPRRVRAPGPDSRILLDILARMRALGAEVRAIEEVLAATPPAGHGPLVRRLDRVFAARQDVMAEWVEDRLPRLAAAGAAYSSVELGARPVLSALLRREIELIQLATFEEVAGSTRFLTADARRFIRAIAKAQTEISVAQGVSIPEAARLVAARMRGGGIRAFIDASGRAWRLETYSEMLVRTRTAEAYSRGTITRAKELGVEVFEVFDGVVDDEACAEANGMIVSAAWADANVIEHPNCRRAFGPRPDLTAADTEVA